MGQNLYLEVTNVCMHRCRTCPKGNALRTDPPYFTPVEEVLRLAAEDMALHGTRTVTLSGGEPLMHPGIVEIVSKLRALGMRTTMLTNLQRLREKGLGAPLKAADPALRIVTALHSRDPLRHDAVTGYPGSHEAALRSVDELTDLGIDVTIKIILSLQTCGELRPIFDLCRQRWGRKVRLNLCGLDLCGSDENVRSETPIDYYKEGELIDRFMDDAEAFYGPELGKYISFSEYPLCCIDPVFWSLAHMTGNGRTAYIDRGGISTSDRLRTESTCGTHARPCRTCAAEPLCPGLWYSVYRQYGDGIVRPWKAEG